MDLDPAVVFFDDAVTDAQSQSGSLAQRLGREKRVEDALADCRVDPATVVRDIDAHAHGFRLGLGMDRDHAGLICAGVDCVGQEIDNDLMNLGRPTADRRQGTQVHDDAYSALAGITLDDVDRRLDPRIEVNFVPVTFVHAGKEPQLLDDALDSPEPLAGSFDQSGQVGQAVIQVDPLIQIVDPLDELRLDLLELGLALSIDLDQTEQVVEIAFQNRDVVADEREWIVDLVCNARDEMPQAGHLFGLNQAALRILESLVSLMLRGCQFLEHHVLLPELLFRPDPGCHIPEDALDSDGLAIVREQGRLHDLNVEDLSLGSDVLLDDIEHLPAVDDPPIVAPVLLGELAGPEIEIGLAQNLVKAAPSSRRIAGSRR